ncbi:hypothetical protein SCLCIDRAFT_1211375 [Scleroderma citrinum Foug A]|uniref:Uncharacterized protein n=1 Tax=Scleroderma citrinum Foug A TaxID=1036808 RepID=A0A0C3AMH1_9AGAM|nr:hypothetical protein SCLCIDRAFT_1211375 [Scleroderma citrinum Foug A]
MTRTDDVYFPIVLSPRNFYNVNLFSVVLCDSLHSQSASMTNAHSFTKNGFLRMGWL